ncbi:glycosyl transferase group 1 [Cellulomonas flavigena DSM 20109]|uniref:D-inositol 3-phosphate glycosyltransferase n=1 Tax=Cellulomonas flavigena (strain ATCC 482 / DSM 20109 / BCRC 11376 / JCM 18109 / NBRC 3775 / NCIMB 8073 / NRS 134) TaxID=446466 RepID=D5UJE5_CELFN|nr:glycosyltransferase family 4 protein [Cellulomonas flavigena]ADG73668.1 glycosyl transferase group 1 [Cellulomonas flavigena DSM 20109]
MINDRSLSIAIITQGYSTSGGIQTTARWLRSQLEHVGHTADVYELATSSNDPLSRRLRDPRTWFTSIRIERNETDSRTWHVGASVAEFEPARYLPRRSLTRRLDRYDVVHVVAGAPALALAAARAGRPKVLQVATRVSWERESVRAPHRALRAARTLNTLAVDRLERHALATVDAVLVMNVEMLDYAREHSSGLVLLAPPGVDAARFRPGATPWSGSGPIVSMGRLADTRKGHDRVVAAYHELCLVLPNPPSLVLAGHGALPPHILSAISNVPTNGHVIVRADVADEDLPSLYREASVYIQGSYEEGLGLSVLEAMSSGLPVVATATAGTRETVKHGITGYLVEQSADCARLLAARVVNVLEGAGHAMSPAARDHAREYFSSESTFRRVLQTYQELGAISSVRN